LIQAKKVNSHKELIKISKTGKFGCEMFEKLGKYSLAKFANFADVCITKLLPFLSRKW
jgi:hypothetical protein